jgi:hypothetical protein
VHPLHPARIALVVICILLLIVGILMLIARRRAGELYRRHVVESRRERLLLASLSFFITFAAVRVLTHAIRAGRGPFRNLQIGGQHIHHLVWGILILLLSGYCWLLQIGAGEGGGARWVGRIMSVLYAVGAALTLDEFALWLNLEDVYWEREGRASIDAVILFGGFLSIGIWGGAFIKSLVKEAHRVTKQKA